MSRVWPFLSSGRFIPGSFLIIWTLFAHASTAVFATQVWSKMNTWLGNNAWFGFFAGFVLLIICLRWESVEKKVAEYLPLPSTLSGRIDELSTRIEQTQDKLLALMDLQNKYATVNSKSIESLETDRLKHIGQLSDLSIRASRLEVALTETDLRAQAATILIINELRPELVSVTDRVRTLEEG